ncbi:hypothetical protein CC85DRAFT_310888 [Cutaneotrichosporon oleaginosum]|uniref:Uncharacterized protein n=1 Tax=Cutaneotrichosporon oleaginosum TaxID=879819 RepID=A0A0J0XUS2_9TREE|nr:uncharacterized protein CC85DRAFT_310888 [Cutaneotrichosporon oleaginosum]KLT44820.1 hypothetical protein CC85DRAFT_310888 [Cutaneotrichosporon oleaginosum]TXT11959.1 hypothetical protein COLE_02369 [Cutaneotrichosporon oleaginosum]
MSAVSASATRAQLAGYEEPVESEDEWATVDLPEEMREAYGSHCVSSFAADDDRAVLGFQPLARAEDEALTEELDGVIGRLADPEPATPPTGPSIPDPLIELFEAFIYDSPVVDKQPKSPGVEHCTPPIAPSSPKPTSIQSEVTTCVRSSPLPPSSSTLPSTTSEAGVVPAAPVAPANDLSVKDTPPLPPNHDRSILSDQDGCYPFCGEYSARPSSTLQVEASTEAPAPSLEGRPSEGGVVDTLEMPVDHETPRFMAATTATPSPAESLREPDNIDAGSPEIAASRTAEESLATTDNGKDRLALPVAEAVSIIPAVSTPVSTPTAIPLTSDDSDGEWPEVEVEGATESEPEEFTSKHGVEDGTLTKDPVDEASEDNVQSITPSSPPCHGVADAEGINGELLLSSVATDTESADVCPDHGTFAVPLPREGVALDNSTPDDIRHKPAANETAVIPTPQPRSTILTNIAAPRALSDWLSHFVPPSPSPSDCTELAQTSTSHTPSTRVPSDSLPFSQSEGSADSAATATASRTSPEPDWHPGSLAQSDEGDNSSSSAQRRLGSPIRTSGAPAELEAAEISALSVCEPVSPPSVGTTPGNALTYAETDTSSETVSGDCHSSSEARVQPYHSSSPGGSSSSPPRPTNPSSSDGQSSTTTVLDYAPGSSLHPAAKAEAAATDGCLKTECASDVDQASSSISNLGGVGGDLPHANPCPFLHPDLDTVTTAAHVAGDAASQGSAGSKAPVLCRSAPSESRLTSSPTGQLSAADTVDTPGLNNLFPTHAHTLSGGAPRRLHDDFTEFNRPAVEGQTGSLPQLHPVYGVWGWPPTNVPCNPRSSLNLTLSSASRRASGSSPRESLVPAFLPRDLATSGRLRVVPHTSAIRHTVDCLEDQESPLSLHCTTSSEALRTIPLRPCPNGNGSFSGPVERVGHSAEVLKCWDDEGRYASEEDEVDDLIPMMSAVGLGRLGASPVPSSVDVPEKEAERKEDVHQAVRSPFVPILTTMPTNTTARPRRKRVVLSSTAAAGTSPTATRDKRSKLTRAPKFWKVPPGMATSSLPRTRNASKAQEAGKAQETSEETGPQEDPQAGDAQHPLGQPRSVKPSVETSRKRRRLSLTSRSTLSPAPDSDHPPAPTKRKRGSQTRTQPATSSSITEDTAEPEQSAADPSSDTAGPAFRRKRMRWSKKLVGTSPRGQAKIVSRPTASGKRTAAHKESGVLSNDTQRRKAASSSSMKTKAKTVRAEAGRAEVRASSPAQGKVKMSSNGYRLWTKEELEFFADFWHDWHAEHPGQTPGQDAGKLCVEAMKDAGYIRSAKSVLMRYRKDQP